MTTIALSKEDCYVSLPDFYEMLADKMHECNGGSRPTIDCTKIRITKSVYDEIKRCLKETYSMTPLEITSLFLIFCWVYVLVVSVRTLVKTIVRCSLIGIFQMKSKSLVTIVGMLSSVI